jgi:hypothetical protein
MHERCKEMRSHDGSNPENEEQIVRYSWFVATNLAQNSYTMEWTSLSDSAQP